VIETRAHATPLSPFADPNVSTRLPTGHSPTSCRLATTAEHQAIVRGIRHQVFVVEQRLFTGSDQDVHDDDPQTRHVLGLLGDLIVGTVRLYPIDGSGQWKGDRLAVLPAYRHTRLGRPLVNFAVRTAGEAGGDVMLAHVQPQNVAFFERLGWRCVGEPAPYVGVMHQQMAIDLHPRGPGPG
jgi:putative N-acetyltransferase (TIGR04045 family)